MTRKILLDPKFDRCVNLEIKLDCLKSQVNTVLLELFELTGYTAYLQEIKK